MEDIKHVRIRQALADLALPPEVTTWSKHHVKQWLLWETREFFLRCLNLMDVDGETLVAMDLRSFQLRVPNLAKFLSQEKELWLLESMTVVSEILEKKHEATSTDEKNQVKSSSKDANANDAVNLDQNQPTDSLENTSVVHKQSPQKLDNGVKKVSLSTPMQVMTEPSGAEVPLCVIQHEQSNNRTVSPNTESPDKNSTKSTSPSTSDCVAIPTTVVPSYNCDIPPPPPPLLPISEAQLQHLAGQPPPGLPFIRGTAPVLTSGATPVLTSGSSTFPVPPSFQNIPLIYAGLNSFPQSANLFQPFSIHPLPPLPPFFSPNLQGAMFKKAASLQASSLPSQFEPHSKDREAVGAPESPQHFPGLPSPRFPFSDRRRRSRGSRVRGKSITLARSQSDYAACQSEPTTPLEGLANEPGPPMLSPVTPEFSPRLPNDNVQTAPIMYSMSGPVFPEVKCSPLDAVAQNTTAIDTTSQTCTVKTELQYAGETPPTDDSQSSPHLSQLVNFPNGTLKPEDSESDEGSIMRNQTGQHYSDVSSGESEAEGDHVNTPQDHTTPNIPNLSTFHEFQNVHGRTEAGGSHDWVNVNPNVHNFPNSSHTSTRQTYPWARADPPPVKIPRKRGRPPGSRILARPLRTSDVINGEKSTHLWRFLLELLEQPEKYATLLKWLDRPRGVFKILNSSTVAKMWGDRKKNVKMTYDKFSRSIRQYYKKGIIIKTKPSKLIYQFGPEYFDPTEG